MRRRCDEACRKTGMNVTLLATPAEGLSGRFVKIDRRLFGEIPGVTDREYYTNSFHVPVYYDISAVEKIRIEAPYHALTNAGHISYVELDGDTTQNLEAFEKIVRVMKESGIGYGSINHPVDRDPACGYNGIIGDTCPNCGRSEEDGPFERIRRITGYLVGTLDRFNDAKRAEEARSRKARHLTKAQAPAFLSWREAGAFAWKKLPRWMEGASIRNSLTSRLPWPSPPEAAKAAGSEMASSERTLRLMSTPATFRPLIMRE